MARIRTIKPEFPQSESMGRISRDARLLFVELWTICDDSGRTRAASRMLASLLFPYDDDAPSLIDGWLEELERENCIVRYTAEGSTYIQVCKWLEHQKIDRPSESKIPPFDESSRVIAKPREASSLDQGPRTKDQGREARSDASTAEPSPPVVCLPLNDGSEYPVTEMQVAEFAGLYRAVNVTHELRAMRAWCISNPTKRKTKSGVLRFVNSWLSGQQNSPPQAAKPRAASGYQPIPGEIL